MSESLPKDTLLRLDKSELLQTLKKHGLRLPQDFAADTEFAEDFVAEYVPLIMNGRVDPTVPMFNDEQPNELLFELGVVLKDLGLVSIRPRTISRNTYTLQDSTLIGSWSSSYRHYNCYAYSLGKTSGLRPGALSGEYFSLTMDISEMADVVLADLASEGYWGYKTPNKPSSLPDSYFKVIAMRKATTNQDYHFMRIYNDSLNSWAHKPSGGQTMLWNYTSPSAKIWTNEMLIEGVICSPYIDYNSDVYYILYKHRDDPGIQPDSLNVELR